MDYEGEMFAGFSRTQGKVRLESDGDVQEKDCSSANFMNAAGTIGYSEATVDGRPDYIFVSRTAAGIVLTMPGEQTGPAPFPIEGYKAVSSVMSGSPARAFYEAHMQALAGEPPLPDREWLEREVPLLPQRALDVTMKVFAIACEQMDRMMAGMGNAMGEILEGMGKAMGKAMEGVGTAMGEALGAADEEKTPKKAAPAPPVVKRSPRKPARKAAAKKPARRPAPRKPTRKAAPDRKPARKAKGAVSRRRSPAGRKKKK